MSNVLAAARTRLGALAGALRRHPLVASGLLLTAGIVVARAFERGRGAQAVEASRRADFGMRHGSFPPLLLVTAAAAFLTDPEGVTLMRGLDQFGSVVPLVAATFVGAALPEELFRLLVQSRLGRAFNPAGGWFIASAAWAFVHMPAWYAEGEDLLGAALGCVRIVPLGLMWGYVTYRTGSIWSVWVLHGANLWGLQNF